MLVPAGGIHHHGEHNLRLKICVCLYDKNAKDLCTYVKSPMYVIFKSVRRRAVLCQADVLLFTCPLWEVGTEAVWRKNVSDSAAALAVV